MKKVRYFDPFPPEVRVIGVPAPASGVDGKKLAEALRIAEELGIKVKLGDFRNAPKGEKYFSSDVPYRIEEMNRFLRDEEIHMILCARGGYGSAYLLPHLDYEALKNRKTPLPIGGYSDITALHLGLLSRNIFGGISCTMFGHFADVAGNRDMALSMRESISSALKMGRFLSPADKIPGDLSWKKRFRLRHSFAEGGKFLPVQGSLLPANLTLLTRMCGTPYFPDLSNRLLLVEEVREAPRKVDFSFLQLHLAGLLEKCAGVLLGQYTDCGTSRELFRIFRRMAKLSKKPFFGFIPFGHGEHPSSLICGEPCRIEEDGSVFLLR